MTQPPAAPPAAAPAAPFDRVAIGLSLACLIHCLVLPPALVMLPLVAAAWPEDLWVHAGLFAIALPVAVLALYRGWRLHRRRWPALLGLVGLCGLAAGLLMHSLPLGETAERAASVTGASALALAHLLNLRCRHHARP
ncbi:MAG: MerC domain-containing protein [Rhodothalassiaceae bacterium]